MAVEKVVVSAFSVRGTNFPSHERAAQCATALGLSEASITESTVAMRRDFFDANQASVKDPASRWTLANA